MGDYLGVKPADMEDMAKHQDLAAEKLGKGAKAADGLGLNMWLSHGPICGYNNTAVEDAESVRRTAGTALQQVCVALAAQVRAAKQTYLSTDHESEDQIDKQVLPK